MIYPAELIDSSGLKRPIPITTTDLTRFRVNQFLMRSRLEFEARV